MANTGPTSRRGGRGPDRRTTSKKHASDAMGLAFSVAAAPHAPSFSLNDLHEELLANVLRFMAPRDVEALTCASKIVARDVLPHFPIWKELFCYRWSMLNFELERGHDGVVAIEIDERLKTMFPSGCSESRMYQLLAHAVTPVPSFADVRQTQRASPFSISDHAIETLPANAPRRRTLDVAYAGNMLGGDRCVRANEAFSTTFRVAVYAISDDRKQKVYRVGAAASGYFEISIRARKLPFTRSVLRFFGNDVTSIGIGMKSFPLIDRQPGWDGNSIGYHGDDGHLFVRHNRGRPFSVSFGAGDTVGCGIKRDLESQRTSIYFTNNGDIIPYGDRSIECPHVPWYPVVGLDSLDIIHFNFGQEPFACTAAVDALLSECEGQMSLLASQLPWYAICESDAESSASEVSEATIPDSAEDDSDEEYDMMNDDLSEASDFSDYVEDVMSGQTPRRDGSSGQVQGPDPDHEVDRYTS